jgi:hypothetical protein
LKSFFKPIHQVETDDTLEPAFGVVSVRVFTRGKSWDSQGYSFSVYNDPFRLVGEVQ